MKEDTMIRTIFVGASGGSANHGAVELACQLAAHFGAHVEGYHVKFDPNDILIAAADGGVGMPIDSGWFDQMVEDTNKRAKEIGTAFLVAAERHGLSRATRPGRMGASASWREEVGYASRLIADRARFFDLAVLGRSDRVIDRPASDVIEWTLLDSGRPVLLAPETPAAAIGDVVAVGWDGSPQSVRAIALAMPLLQKATKIVLLTIADTGDADVGAARDYFGWHSILAEVRQVQGIEGVRVGEQLMSAARDDGADLLVMGAFGRAPWREALFGGATRTIVKSCLLPVMMCH
jgi:nucleotide-binding universal stress UspA family protein